MLKVQLRFVKDMSNFRNSPLAYLFSLGFSHSFSLILLLKIWHDHDQHTLFTRTFRVSNAALIWGRRLFQTWTRQEIFFLNFMVYFLSVRKFYGTAVLIRGRRKYSIKYGNLNEPIRKHEIWSNQKPGIFVPWPSPFDSYDNYHLTSGLSPAAFSINPLRIREKIV